MIPGLLLVRLEGTYHTTGGRIIDNPWYARHYDREAVGASQAEALLGVATPGSHSHPGHEAAIALPQSIDDD